MAHMAVPQSAVRLPCRPPAGSLCASVYSREGLSGSSADTRYVDGSHFRWTGRHRTIWVWLSVLLTAGAGLTLAMTHLPPEGGALPALLLLTAFVVALIGSCSFVRCPAC